MPNDLLNNLLFLPSWTMDDNEVDVKILEQNMSEKAAKTGSETSYSAIAWNLICHPMGIIFNTMWPLTTASYFREYGPVLQQ